MRQDLFICVFLFTILLANCGDSDINKMSLKEAKEKGIIADLYNHSEGLQAARLSDAFNNKLGFYNTNGKLIIPFEYYRASDEEQIMFRNGLAPVADKNKKAGYINSKNEWIIKPQYDFARSFYDNIAFVHGKFNDGMKAAYLKNDGSFFIMPKYSMIYYFPIDKICIFLDKNKKWGLCKPNGNIVVNPIYDDAISVFEGSALFILKGKYGFIDLSGNQITDFGYDKARNFINGTAIVAKKQKGVTYSYGIIDLHGEYLIPLREDIEIEVDDLFNGLYLFQDYSEFKPWQPNPVINGAFSAKLKKTGLYGLMNLKGEWIVDPKFNTLDYEGNNQFRYITQNKQKGLIDPNGRIITQN
jgi:hypothetical protein